MSKKYFSMLAMLVGVASCPGAVASERPINADPSQAEGRVVKKEAKLAAAASNAVQEVANDTRAEVLAASDAAEAAADAAQAAAAAAADAAVAAEDAAQAAADASGAAQAVGEKLLRGTPALPDMADSAIPDTIDEDDEPKRRPDEKELSN